MIRLPMLIGGEEVFKDEVIDVIYPYNQQKVGEAVKGSVEDVEKAVEKAKVGLKN